MKVSELIEQLEMLSQESEVLIEADAGYADVGSVYVRKIDSSVVISPFSQSVHEP